MRDLPHTPVESALVLQHLRTTEGRRELTFIRVVSSFRINHKRLIVAILHQVVSLNIDTPLAQTHSKTEKSLHCFSPDTRSYPRPAETPTSQPDREPKSLGRRRKRGERNERLRAKHLFF
jgi:hypothetical protein